MATLSNLDLILIFAYFIALLLLGYFTSRRQKEEDYLIAERKLGTWSTMATMNASKSGSIFMIFVALTYLWGFSAIWYFMGVVTGALIFVPFAMKLKEKSSQRYYTLADYFRYNYGKTPAAIESIITIILMLGLLVLNAIAGTKLFVFFTGWPFWICALIMIAVVLFYLFLAGFKAVVKTDILQYIAMMTILIILAVLLFNGSLIPASEWDLFQAGTTAIIGFFIVGIMFAFGSPDLWQRVYSAKGKKELRNGLLLSIAVYALMAFLLALIALTVKVNFPGINPDTALIHGFANLLPPGLLGLSVILLFAAIMSSLDTYIYTASSATVQDFFNWNKKKIVKAIKRTVFIFAALGVIIAIAIQDLVIGSYIFVAFVVVLSVSVLATWAKPSIKSRTLVLSLIFGLLGLIEFLIYSLIKGKLNETIILVTLGSSILGLIIGGIVSRFK